MTITSRDDIDNMMRFAIKGAIFGSAVGLSLGVYFATKYKKTSGMQMMTQKRKP